MLATQRQSARPWQHDIAKRSAERAYASAAPMTAAQWTSCACGGGCPRCVGTSKLAVTQPGDASERAADALAARAMNAPRRISGFSRAQDHIGTAMHSTGTPIALGPGTPLDTTDRAFFEPRFGADLSAVSIHTGEPAAAVAAQLGARAFASGSHVAFAAGEYSPGSASGRELLAHELAHTLQPPTAAPTIHRQTADAEPEERRRLRTALVGLIPRVLYRIEQSVIRGYGGLYEFESRTPGGGILMGGPGTPEETLHQRRARLLQLASDLRAMESILGRGAIPNNWWSVAVSRSVGGSRAYIGGLGANVEALALMYQQYAEDIGRERNLAFFNYFYIQPLSSATVSARPTDTGIDVIAPDPDRPQRVMRVFGSTPILTDPETGLPNRSPIHRVFRDERGYYYLTGPAWLGPHRRVDLDPSLLE